MSRTHPTIIRKFVWWWRERSTGWQAVICFSLVVALIYSIRGFCDLLAYILRTLKLIE